MNHPFHSSNKDVAQRWSQWQPDAPQHDDDKRPDGQPEPGNDDQGDLAGDGDLALQGLGERLFHIGPQPRRPDRLADQPGQKLRL